MTDTTTSPAFRWRAGSISADPFVAVVNAADARLLRRQYRWLRQAGTDVETARCALLVAFHVGWRTGFTGREALR